MHSPIMSPLVWDLGHIAAYEDLWLAHRHAGLELLRAEIWRSCTTRSRRRARCAGKSRRSDRPRRGTTWRPSARARSRRSPSAGWATGSIYEMVLRHELQHSETMRQTMAIAGLLPAGERPKRDAAAAALAAGEQWLDRVPAGPFAMGAGREGFAYDNERPRHTVDVAAFQIARQPVSNAQLDALQRGRRLRAARVVVGRGLGVEGGVRHHPSPGDGGGRTRGARLPRLLVRGRRLRPSARRAPAHRGRVGEGGDLGAG